MADKKPLPWLKKGWTLCLASASPRRRELLSQVGIVPYIFPTSIDESVDAGESPVEYVKRMAVSKARAGLVSGHERILAADTIVVLDGKILGKPRDAEEAGRMLGDLSGREHLVITAIAMTHGSGDEIHSKSVQSRVWFKNTSSAEIAAYVATGEPMDKAGAYGIQGIGAFMIQKVEGSYTGVVGLPMFETLELLSNYN